MVKKSKKHREITAYIFWGIMSTIVSWGSYILFENIGINILISNILIWICAVTFAFITNKLWVFASKSFDKATVFKELSSFFLQGCLPV